MNEETEERAAAGKGADDAGSGRTTTQKPWRKIAIGLAAVVVIILGIVAASISPAADQPDEIASPNPQTPRTGQMVGKTAGFNIVNATGLNLVYQRVAGHVAAPPLQPGGIWLPGATLNFELDVGVYGWNGNTGDALFEAQNSDGSDAGNVDIHFSTFQWSLYASGYAYLNPLETAPIKASSNFTPFSYNGETFTMSSTSLNTLSP